MNAIDNCTVLDPEEAALLHREKRDTHAYWKARLAVIEAAGAASIPALFKGAVCAGGSPIEAGVQDMILGYMNSPSLESWLELRSLMICASTTLWQAWIMVDPFAPRRGTSGPHPSAKALIRAIRTAVDSDRESVRAKLLENPEPGPCLRLVK